MTAQVWRSPALIWRKRSVVATAIGRDRAVSVASRPSPSWPLKLLPQQYARPSVVMPQVWAPPELTCLNWSGAVAAAPTALEAPGRGAATAGPLKGWLSSPQPMAARVTIGVSRVVSSRAGRRMAVLSFRVRTSIGAVGSRLNLSHRAQADLKPLFATIPPVPASFTTP